ncbi:TadE family protein (plasmid) [Streptomyces alboflavus]|uniref:TadE family protein n=1 Tax=Streptomyces alboflavus TaxID=67267 RepID=A0A291W4W8_9ACTN|nr:TadE/TadG family type IV pilus assembly protein [Streptomyces alboflavus]ATM24681.1 TadE family protein [Streptomyces alboflavus]
MTSLWQRSRTDDGRIAVEFVLWVPAVLLFFALAMIAGRITTANHTVDAAAADAAREASLARTAGQAQPRAQAAAQAAFTQNKLHCSSTSVTVDTSGFSAPLGQYGAVTARVRCTVQLADLGPGFGSKTVESSFTSVIDRYRQR